MGTHFKGQNGGGQWQQGFSLKYTNDKKGDFAKICQNGPTLAVQCTAMLAPRGDSTFLVKFS